MSSFLRTPHPRRVMALAALSLATSGLTLAESASAAKPALTTGRTAIADLPASPGIPLLPQIDAAGDTIVAIAPVAGLTSSSPRSASSGEVWLSTKGAAPTRLGVAAVPAWAQPHLGTDQSGRAVAIYPRCASDAIDSCDLYVFDIDARRERALTEANTDQAGELEGTMQGGALAWTVAPSGQSKGAADDPKPARTLMYRAAGGTSVKITAKGGQQLALRGGRIAQVAPNADENSDRVELFAAATRKRTTLANYSYGAAGHWGVGLRFFGDELRFAVASNDRTSLYRVPLSRPRNATRIVLSTNFTAAAFATRTKLVFIAETNEEDSAPLVSALVPKSLR